MAFRGEPVDFEWDEAKSERNRVERNLPFDIVLQFDWENSLTVDSSRGEDRFVTLGAHGGGYLLIVWAPRGSDRRRVISLRRMHAKEARKYGL